MMENYERNVQLIDTAYNSAGKSSEQFAKYQDTIEMKLKTLSNTWEQLRTSFLSSDTYKTVLNQANNVLETINEMDAKDFISFGLIGITLGKTLIQNLIKGLQGSSSLIKTEVEKIKQSIGQKFNSGNPINVIYNMASIDALQAKLNALGVPITNLTQKTGSLLIEYIKINDQVDQLQAELVQQESITGRQSLEYEEINQKLRQQQALQANITEELREQGIEQNDLENINGIVSRDKEEGNSEGSLLNTARGATATSLGVKGQIASDAITGGLTTALMAGIATKDLGSALKTGLIGAVTSAIPAVLNYVIPIATKAIIGAVGGLSAGVAAAIIAPIAALGIGLYIAHEIEEANKAARDAELKRLKEVKEINEDLLKSQTESLDKAKSAKRDEKTLADTTERYQELSGKAFLTANETTELEGLKTTLENDYSEVISSVDEATGILEINTKAVENLTEEYKKTQEEELENARVNDALISANNDATVNTLNGLIKQYQDEEYKTLRLRADTDFTNVQNFVPNSLAEGETVSIGTGLDLFEVGEELKAAFGEDSDVLKELNISDDTFNTGGNIRKYLSENYQDNIGQFMTDLAGVLEGESAALVEEGRKQARESAQAIYSTIEVNGEKMSDEMARSLSYGFEDVVEKKKEDYRNLVENSTNADGFETTYKDYLRYIQDTDGSIPDDLKNAKIEDTNLAAAIKQVGYEEKDLFAGGTNLKELDQLPEELQAFITEQLNKTEDDFNDNIRKSSQKSWEVLREFYTNQALAQSDLFSDIEELIPGNEEELSQVMTLFENIGSYTQEEFLNQLTTMVASMDAELRESFLKGQGLTWKDGRVQELGEGIEDSAYYAYETAIKQLGENGLNLVGYAGLTLDQQNQIAVQTQKTNLAGADQKGFAQRQVEFFTGRSLTSEQAGVFNSIDLSAGYAEVKTQATEYINGLVALGMSLEDATTAFEEYISASKDFLHSSVNTAGAELLQDNISGSYAATIESYKVLKEAMSEYQENGIISNETFYKLQEENLDEFVDRTSKGYEILGEKTSEFYNQQLKSGYNTYKAAQEEQNEYVNTLKGGMVEYRSSGFSYTKPLVEALDYFKTHEDELEKYTGRYKDIIKDFLDSGAATGAAFLSEKVAGQAALKAGEQDVYLQYLYEVSNLYTENTEKVEELEEKLDDLNNKIADTNKELEDLDGELADAEKALEEAKHGTDEWLASQDPFKNYTESAELFRKEIEKATEALENSQSVQESSQLQGQRNSSRKQLKTNLLAQNQLQGQNQSQILDLMAQSGYDDYMSLINDQMVIDWSKLNYSELSDVDKDRVVALQEQWAESVSVVRDNTAEIEEIEKAHIEEREKYLNDRVSLEGKIRDILQRQQDEEIESKKEYYDELKKADDDYLNALEDAVEKQRQLREQENQYNELAQKEKRLSLMSRDTSGANQKEINSLQDEIANDRQSLLDSEVDNIIDSLRQQYELQQEMRDLQIEEMEVEKESSISVEQINAVLSSFKNQEDAIGWFMENDPESADKTVSEQEQEILEIQKLLSGFYNFESANGINFDKALEVVPEEVQSMVDTYGNILLDYNTLQQNIAEEAKIDAINSAQETVDGILEKRYELREELKSLQDEATTTQNSLADAMKNSSTAMDVSLETMKTASQTQMSEVVAYAIREIAAMRGVDISDTNSEEAKSLAAELGQVRDGNYSEGWAKAVENVGGDTSNISIAKANQSWSVYNRNDPSSTALKNFSSEQEAKSWISSQKNSSDLYVGSVDTGNQKGAFIKSTISSGKYRIVSADGTVLKDNFYSEKEAAAYLGKQAATTPSYRTAKIKKYANGGLVNYTGQAWVDGTPTKPEAFLNAEDTRRIGDAAKLLADLPIFNSTDKAKEMVSTNIGDTTIEIHLNVESLSSDYDVDQMINRVKSDILEVAKPIGSSVILNK